MEVRTCRNGLLGFGATPASDFLREADRSICDPSFICTICKWSKQLRNPVDTKTPTKKCSARRDSSCVLSGLQLLSS
ncbi:hypothetical protein VTI28DRAFT_8546 [Corynascus sepedonium]